MLSNSEMQVRGKSWLSSPWFCSMLVTILNVVFFSGITDVIYKCKVCPAEQNTLFSKMTCCLSSKKQTKSIYLR